MDAYEIARRTADQRWDALKAANDCGYSSGDIQAANTTIALIVGRAYARARTGSVKTDPVYNMVAASALVYQKGAASKPLANAILKLPDLPEHGDEALRKIEQVLSFYQRARYSTPSSFTERDWTNLLIDWRMTIALYLGSDRSSTYRAQIDRSLAQIVEHYRDLWS